MLDVSWGTVLWSSLAFLIVVFILAKMAWKPILNSIKEREDSIEDALTSAAKAKEEMANLKASNQNLLNEARMERDAMMKEARETKEQIINAAKTAGETERDKIIASARESIQSEKMAAISEIKNQVATLSLDIAEKIVRENLSSDEKQKQLVSNLLDKVKMN